jgi:hypothetical protein
MQGRKTTSPIMAVMPFALMTKRDPPRDEATHSLQPFVHSLAVSNPWGDPRSGRIKPPPSPAKSARR